MANKGSNVVFDFVCFMIFSEANDLIFLENDVVKS